ncbi:bifunctional riboflavin kinase/FAD synthetase [Myroides ceti]|uniref:Riboflavin biosynthesis protein n=1 Tax=Paenimyroides ceti TaxID=395087 RepID=A0ABT8CZD4_9FLAO|nr:bifunctional riboflavin kinase/FAD synthetase [Paenimyroides ceti]MDN3708427.1 bifunctional riboflavin kinase/FAD synthetase [Paenimyroides ceti]
MKVFNAISEFYSDKKTIVTLGTFDGVHLGHQSILKKLTRQSHETGAESLVLTFFPHPRMVLDTSASIQLLNTIHEKTVLLEHFGVDHLVIHPFSKEFASLSAEEFVKKILVEQFNIQKIIIGYDHRFGKNRSADINDLIKFGQKYGFEVEQILAKEIDHISVSSTKIRKALEEGNIALANEYLGYAYSLEGTVVEGKKIGRTIGFPTANIVLEEDYKLVPHNGVYIVSSIINGEIVKGMMNIGTNPTIGTNPRTIEVNFLNFEGNLYGKKLKISILDKIRDEMKFSSLEELKENIEKDRLKTIHYFEKLRS